MVFVAGAVCCTVGANGCAFVARVLSGSCPWPPPVAGGGRGVPTDAGSGQLRPSSPQLIVPHVITATLHASRRCELCPTVVFLTRKRPHVFPSSPHFTYLLIVSCVRVCPQNFPLRPASSDNTASSSSSSSSVSMVSSGHSSPACPACFSLPLNGGSLGSGCSQCFSLLLHIPAADNVAGGKLPWNMVFTYRPTSGQLNNTMR